MTYFQSRYIRHLTGFHSKMFLFDDLCVNLWGWWWSPAPKKVFQTDPNHFQGLGFPGFRRKRGGLGRVGKEAYGQAAKGKGAVDR